MCGTCRCVAKGICSCVCTVRLTGSSLSQLARQVAGDFELRDGLAGSRLRLTTAPHWGDGTLVLGPEEDLTTFTVGTLLTGPPGNYTVTESARACGYFLR